MDVVIIDNDKLKFPFTDVDEDGNIKKLTHFDDITNHNCAGMCAEKTCSEKYTKFAFLTLNGVEIVIALCDKHAEEMGKFSEKYNLSLIERGI